MWGSLGWVSGGAECSSLVFSGWLPSLSLSTTCDFSLEWISQDTCESFSSSDLCLTFCWKTLSLERKNNPCFLCSKNNSFVKSQFSVPLAKSSGQIFWLLILLMGMIGIYKVLFFFYNLWLVKTVFPETQIWKSKGGLKHFFLFAFLL